MSCSGIPPPLTGTKDQQPHHQRHQHRHHRKHPMSFRSSVGSKPSRLGPHDGRPITHFTAPVPVPLPPPLRIDLPMKQAICNNGGTSGRVGTSGYYATDMMETLGSSWISRLRRPSPQPPPQPQPPLAAAAPATPTAQSVATDGTAGTEGSGVHGGAGGSRALGPAAQPESVPYLTSAYHVQRLCIGPLGLEDKIRRCNPQQPPVPQQQQQQTPPPPRQQQYQQVSSSMDRLKGFGPLRFSEARVDEYVNGIKRIPPILPPERAPPPLQRTQSHPPQRTNPVPKPWNLGAYDDAEANAAGRLNPRPASGFFPLFANIVRAAEGAQDGPNANNSSALTSFERAEADHVTRPHRTLLPFGAGREEDHQYHSPERAAATPFNSGPSQTRVFPLHSNTSTGGSTVRLPSDGSTSQPDFHGRQRSSNEWRMGVNTGHTASSSHSLSDGVSPVDGGGHGIRRISPFGSFRGPGSSTVTATKGCVPAVADTWRHHSSALPGIAESTGGSHKTQMLYTDATAANDGSFPAARSRSRLAPPCGSGSEDRFPFWNMGRFWSSGGAAASETPSRKRPQGNDAVVSPLKCRKLGNQG